MKSGQWFWVSRDMGDGDGVVELHRTKPTWDEGDLWWFGFSEVASHCVGDFYRFTGIKLKPGECKRVRLTPEVK